MSDDFKFMKGKIRIDLNQPKILDSEQKITTFFQ